MKETHPLEEKNLSRKETTFSPDQTEQLTELDEKALQKIQGGFVRPASIAVGTIGGGFGGGFGEKATGGNTTESVLTGIMGAGVGGLVGEQLTRRVPVIR